MAYVIIFLRLGGMALACFLIILLSGLRKIMLRLIDCFLFLLIVESKACCDAKLFCFYYSCKIEFEAEASLLASFYRAAYFLSFLKAE